MTPQKRPGPRGRPVMVAPILVLTILKLVAYRDRPTERGRDLVDLASILTDYDPEDRLVDDVTDLGLSYKDAGPFLLAQKLPKIVNEVERFVRQASDEDDPSGVHTKLVASGPPSWRRESEELHRSVRAFARGLR